MRNDNFGNLTFGKLMTFGDLTFGVVTFGEMPFGDLTFGEVAFGDLTFGEPTGHQLPQWHDGADSILGSALGLG